MSCDEEACKKKDPKEMVQVLSYTVYIYYNPLCYFNHKIKIYSVKLSTHLGPEDLIIFKDYRKSEIGQLDTFLRNCINWHIPMFILIITPMRNSD